MEQAKGKTFTVPATVYYTDDGVLSVDLKIIDNDDSPLRIMLEGKTVDENQSVVGMFAKRINGSDYLPKSCIVLSGLFQLVDSAYYKPPEETIKRAMLLLAERIVEHSDCCNFCARQDKCNDERDNLSDGKWVPPDSDVCAEHIVKYFYDKAKK